MDGKRHISKRVFKPANCVDCGIPFDRVNSKQIRCKDCQEMYAAIKKREYQRSRRKAKKVSDAIKVARRNEYLARLNKAVNL